jgi:hypothetical protein
MVPPESSRVLRWLRSFARWSPSAAFTANEIYPEIWGEPETECLDDYVLHYFEELKQFLKKAHEQHRGLVVYLI